MLPTRLPCPPRRSPLFQVRQGLQARPCSSSRSEASVTSQTACVLVVRSSVCGPTSFLFMMRFVFSPACENPSESTTVRRTNYQSSQAELCLHSCTVSSASRPEQACDPSQADDWQRSVACAHARHPKWCASSTCLDSKAPLPIVFDVFKTNSAL